jgi:type VI secretion system secreted protein Hcp
MAMVDYFLRIDGIEGESQDSKHKGEIELLSWNWSEAQSGTQAKGGGGGAGKVRMQDFQFAMRLSKASPKLLLACASGDHIKQAVLTCRKAGTSQQEFLKVTISDFLVSSFQMGSGSPADVLPSERITLNYAKIEFEYKEQKADGSLNGPVKAGWNLKANAKI